MRIALELPTRSPDSPSILEYPAPRVGLCSYLPAAAALRLALGLTDDDGTVLLRVAEHRLLRGEAEAELSEVLAQAQALELQHLEDLLSTAASAQQEGDLAAAAHAYELALEHLNHESGPKQVLVLVSLAEVERARGRGEVAAALLDRALAQAPTHIGALCSRVALAVESGDPALAAALRRRLAPQLETSAKRVEVLKQVAAESLKVAGEAIAYASELIPGSVYLLRRLRAVNEASGDYEAALTNAVQIAELAPDPKTRAQALVEAAHLCSEHVGHTQRAVALYEAAIQDDPEVPAAFEAIEAVLLGAGDVAGLGLAYERQFERLMRAGSIGGQCSLLRRLAAHQRDRLGQPVLAAGTLEKVVKLAPRDVSARVELAQLLEQTGETARATRALEQAAALDPARVETYRTLTRLLHLAGDEDRVYSTCSVLVALGEADLDEQLSHAQHRPETFPSIRNVVDEDAWAELVPEDHPAAFDALAQALEEAALDVWVDPASRSSSTLLPPQDRVDPVRSTVTAARCFIWAAGVLGLPQPEVYIDPQVTRTAAQILPKRTLSILLGRPVLGGRTTGELAFLAAHHLTYARPGWRLLSLCGGQDEIRSVFLAGAAVTRPDLQDQVASRSRAAELAERLASCLGPEQKARIADLFEPVLACSPHLEVHDWACSVEQIACRAGLLTSGDITVASTVLSVAGTCPSGQSAAERARAVLPFCVSQRHAALRHWLGIAVPSRV